MAGKEERSRKISDTVLSILENNFSRSKKLRDPVTRHIVFLEKLLMIQDVVLAGLNNFGTTEDQEERVRNLAKEINDEIGSLIDWIQQPIYSPDHPVGAEMMKESKENFDSRKF